MPCSCEGYPEPTIEEQVANLRQKYETLYACHQQVVAERDRLLEQNAKLLQVLGEKALNHD